MNTVRWGLLSTANINRRLIPAIRASQRGELIAVASRSQESAESYAAKWGIPQAFGSYEAMFDSGQIDAIYISLPNHLHAEWSIRAMQSGIHVLCEKPFAVTLEEVDRMIAASQQHQRVLTEALMYRHHPQTKIVGEWIRDGRLGEISLVHGAFNFFLSQRDNVRLVPDYSGGSLWDVGIYPMSYAQYVYGAAPLAVSGMQWVGDSGVDEAFAGQMIYPGGGLAQISSAFRTQFHTFIEIIGTEGRLSLNRPFVSIEDEPHLMFHPKDAEPYEISVPEQELYLGEVEDMHSAILEGAAPYLTLEETRDHVRTILALYESAHTSTIVQLK